MVSQTLFPRRHAAPMTTVLMTALGLVAATHGSTAAADPRQVSLQLVWNHQFQFAGYYAAQQQGYYREAGLEVEIRHGGYEGPGRAADPIEEVVFQRADFGVSRTDLLLQRSRGLPVVVVANIMQHSPLVFLTLERYGFDRLEEIGDRPVSLTLPSVANEMRVSAEALAALKLAGIDYRTLNNHPPSWDLQDLYSGKTQLTPAYTTDEAYFVRRHGETPVEISQDDYGVDFYGDMLFTSEHLYETDPRLVAAFREASLRGWNYALEHPEDIAEYILGEYGMRNEAYGRDFLLHEAELTTGLIQSDIVEIGYTNLSRWQHIAATYRELGLIKSVDLEAFLAPALPADAADWRRVRRWLIPASALMLVVLGIAGYLYAINHRLRREIRRRQQAEGALRRLAEKDGLTGLDNRRLFDEFYPREVSRARRYGQPLALILFDIDRFKAINDTYGHLAGDRVLVEIARLSRDLLRASDYLARYGGEEFVILLPNTHLAEARVIAQRLLEVHRRHEVIAEGRSIRYTLSAGLAELEASDRCPQDLLRRADVRLFLAKRNGRDRLYSDG